MSTYTVTTGNIDSAAIVGTLRWAVGQSNANPGSTINIQVATVELTLAAVIAINQPVTINGNGVVITRTSNFNSQYFTANNNRAGNPIVINNAVFQNTNATSSNCLNANSTNIQLSQIQVIGFTSHIAFPLSFSPFYFASSDILIEGSTFSNCLMSSAGGAIGVDADSNLTIRDSVIDSCASIRTNGSIGGAIYVANSISTFERVTVTNCRAILSLASPVGTGGGIVVASAGSTVRQCTIDSCTISNNTAGNVGSGLAILGASGLSFQILIQNSTFSGNRIEALNSSSAASLYISLSSANIINCTIADNVRCCGIRFANSGPAISTGIYNTTITRNSIDVSETAIMTAGVLATVTPVIVANTIIAGNIRAYDDPDSPDAVIGTGGLGSFTSEGGNVIGVTALGFTQTNDQTGTAASPLNPDLGALADNWGPTLTIAPNLGSVAISNGLIANIPVGIQFDQRLSPFVRIWEGMVDSGSFQTQDTVICFNGDVLILVRNQQTGLITRTPAREVYVNVHDVYCTQTQAFTPVIHNIVTGLARTLIKIPRNLFDLDRPNTDFYATPGHPLWIEGNEIIVENIPGHERVPCTPQCVFSICTDKRRSIWVDNLAAMTWAPRDWHATATANRISWCENKPRNQYLKA